MSCIWYVSKYVAPPADPAGDGVGGRGYELMRELAASGDTCVIVTSDSNHLVAVPDLDDATLLQSRDGMVMCWLRTMKFGRAKSWRRVLGWLHFEWRVLRFEHRALPRPDVVVASSPSLLTALSGWVLSRRAGARFVFEVRDIWPLTLVDEGGFSPRNPAVRLLGLVERFAYRRADSIIGTMPNLGEHVTHVLGRPTSVECVGMGYSPRALEQHAAVSEEFAVEHLPDGGMTIAYAGTIGISNALEPFFEAVGRLAHRSDLHFVVLGDGSLLDDYRAQHAHLPNLRFVPRIAKDEVPSFLAKCDLLYLSTRPGLLWHYGQSLNKLVDYMLSGRPVLASFSGYPSMIDEAECGSIVPAGDVDALVTEIQRYSEMAPAERDEVGARGRAWIMQNRSYRTLAEQFRSAVGLGPR